MTAKRVLPIAGLVLAAIAVALIAGAPRDEGTPLDPNSTGKLGTKALVLLLREGGTSVNIGSETPTADVPVALVLHDNLSPEQRSRLQEWVGAGGTLVVTDPRSDLAGAAAFAATDEGRLTPRCDMDALADVGPIQVPGAPMYTPPAGASICFPERTGRTNRQSAFLVTRPQAAGTVIALGGPDPFVNMRLDQRNNSVLAERLLAPRPGGSLTIMQPPRVGEGKKSLTDLISPGVKAGLLELLIAFGVVCLWRVRRFGRPVLEHQPVELAGSELVVAVGNLLQQARRRGHAAAVLRDDLRRTLSERLNLGPDASVEVVADVAAARTGVDRTELLDALTQREPATDAELVVLAQTIEAVHQEITHAT
jgi:hypothetical protein